MNDAHDTTIAIAIAWKGMKAKLRRFRCDGGPIWGGFRVWSRAGS